MCVREICRLIRLGEVWAPQQARVREHLEKKNGYLVAGCELLNWRGGVGEGEEGVLDIMHGRSRMTKGRL